MRRHTSFISVAGAVLVVTAVVQSHQIQACQQSSLTLASVFPAVHGTIPARVMLTSSIGSYSINDTTKAEELVAVEEEPTFDEKQLASHIQYPDSARRKGIEGTVIVGVLIGKDGRIEKIQIVETAHELLNEAAMNAVRATKFTPAKENGKPIRVWARIPIRFALR